MTREHTNPSLGIHTKVVGSGIDTMETGSSKSMANVKNESWIPSTSTGGELKASPISKI